MYPHFFPPHWIRGIWYNLFHPSLFCRNDDNWNWGEGGHCDLKRLEERTYWVEGDFLRGEETPKDSMLIKQARFMFRRKTTSQGLTKKIFLDGGR